MPQQMTESARNRLAAMKFTFDDDVRATREVALRIARAAARERTITYSELVEGVTFRLPNVKGGLPFQLGELGEWTDLDRAILGSVLGRISADSYLEAGFLASAVAVSKTTNEPSEGFKSLVRDAGLLKATSGSAFLLFWSDQLSRAYAWYAAHPPLE
jgi:hypothetical protein